MSRNSIVVPEAKEALNKFKMEAASEVGVDLKDGYNGHLTSREAGSVGGQMVKKNCPADIITYTRKMRTLKAHEKKCVYSVYIDF